MLAFLCSLGYSPRRTRPIVRWRTSDRNRKRPNLRGCFRISYSETCYTGSIRIRRTGRHNDGKPIITSPPSRLAILPRTSTALKTQEKHPHTYYSENWAFCGSRNSRLRDCMHRRNGHLSWAYQSEVSTKVGRYDGGQPHRDYYIGLQTRDRQQDHRTIMART